jgi:hypothetical protein
LGKRTCDYSSKEQDGAGNDVVSARDEAGQDEGVQEAPLVVHLAFVESHPEPKVVAEVVGQGAVVTQDICSNIHMYFLLVILEFCYYVTFVFIILATSLDEIVQVKVVGVDKHVLEGDRIETL